MNYVIGIILISIGIFTCCSKLEQERVLRNNHTFTKIEGNKVFATYRIPDDCEEVIGLEMIYKTKSNIVNRY